MARRRDMLRSAVAGLVAASTLPAPAIAQGVQELKMVTTWPKGFRGLDTSAQRLAQSITAISDGRLKVTVYPDGSLVNALEVFDAVSAGVAEMYHAFDPYFEKRLDFRSGGLTGLEPSKLQPRRRPPMAEMTPLRRRMIEDMQVRNLSPVTMMQRGSPRRAMANKKLTGLTLAATRERLADLDRTLLGALLLRR